MGADDEQGVDPRPSPLEHQVGVAGLLADADDLGADVEVVVDVVGPVERQHARHQHRRDHHRRLQPPRHRLGLVGDRPALVVGRIGVEHVGEAGER